MFVSPSLFEEMPGRSGLEMDDYQNIAPVVLQDILRRLQSSQGYGCGKYY